MRLYGLIGRKLSHSFSKELFSGIFQKKGLTHCRYQYFELASADQLTDLIATHPDLVGLNVTIPYKRAVLQMMNALSPEAEAIGTVNCIAVKRQGEEILMYGHNTDAGGFAETLKDIQPGQTRALVLGYGGAARAVVYALEHMGIKVQVVSRDPKQGITYDALGESLIKKSRFVVNTTPLGMYPDIKRCPPMNYSALTPEHLCYDLVYNPPETTFMKRCSAAGSRVVNGLAMLKAQAALSWAFWERANRDI